MIAHERFSMAILAFKTSSYRNAVSRFTAHVSQEMWHDLWPDLPVCEVPITSVTNGVHLPTWLNGDLATLYDQYLQPDWRERYPEPKTWDLIEDIPDQELWEAHRRRKRRLVAFVRERMVKFARCTERHAAAEMRRLAEVLDPDAFTIGFARRFATYKRATLLFRDVEAAEETADQSGYAGADRDRRQGASEGSSGQDIDSRDRAVVARSRSLSKRLVFLEDYGIEVAREHGAGRRYLAEHSAARRRGLRHQRHEGEASTASSISAFSMAGSTKRTRYSGGWAIGEREPYSEDQDEFHASAIYSCWKTKSFRCTMARREDGVPDEWVRRMKQCLRLYQSTVQLPADGSRVHAGIVFSRSRWLLGSSQNRLRTRPPQNSLERFSTEFVGQRQIRRTWSGSAGLCVERNLDSYEGPGRLGRINARRCSG